MHPFIWKNVTVTILRNGVWNKELAQSVTFFVPEWQFHEKHFRFTYMHVTMSFLQTSIKTCNIHTKHNQSHQIIRISKGYDALILILLRKLMTCNRGISKDKSSIFSFTSIGVKFLKCFCVFFFSDCYLPENPLFINCTKEHKDRHM